jgi:uncharacterized coiled-coil protein SlyX
MVVRDLIQRLEVLERIVAMQASIIALRDAEIVRLNEVIRSQNEVIRAQAETIKALEEKVAKLEARLNTNSSISSKPPSTDPEPHITEFQVFDGCCSQCSTKHRGSLPIGTPPGMLGPNALATIA